jgi:hypothetical protein
MKIMLAFVEMLVFIPTIRGLTKESSKFAQSHHFARRLPQGFAIISVEVMQRWFTSCKDDFLHHPIFRRTLWRLTHHIVFMLCRASKDLHRRLKARNPVAGTTTIKIVNVFGIDALSILGETVSGTATRIATGWPDVATRLFQTARRLIRAPRGGLGGFTTTVRGVERQTYRVFIEIRTPVAHNPFR